MLKQLTIAFSVALLSACTVVSDDTDGNSNSNSNTATDTNNTSGTTGSGTTTDGTTNPTTNPTTGTTTDGTTSPTTGTTGEEPTTGVTTTGATTIGTMTTTGSTGEDTEGTTQGTIGTDTDTGGSDYGNCGWNVIGYYACLDKGGVPSTEDPMMIDPIECPQDIMEGATCDDMGMGGIGSVGCCTPEGVNYFCDVEGNKKVFKDDCAA